MTETIIRRAEDSPSVAAELDHGAEWTARQAAAPLKAMGENVTIQKNWQELIRPGKLQVSPGHDPRREATLVAEPLERGFGLTLGNALRRILLSSLQGAAVQSVHIDGVLHEFSSIAGVREDVTDIVLNIKDIAIKMQGDGPKRMVVKKSGPGQVTAGDISTVGDIVVLNPDLVLCTLDEGAEIRMEFTVNTGKGYVASERNRPEDAPIGLIPVDSLFSPVRKVSYKVENTREGQILDYDKLTLQIETNGAVSPEDALAYAARILQDQLNVFVNFEEPRKEVVSEAIPDLAFNPAFLKKVDELELSGAFGQLPEERQHRLYRRPRSEDRSRNAAYPEFRAQVAERNQGSPGADGPASRHGSAGLAAGKHRRPRQALRGSLLSRDAAQKRNTGDTRCVTVRLAGN
jgi:DNA-directed RNA polymerase subunit alpha